MKEEYIDPEDIEIEDDENEDNGDYNRSDWYGGPLNPNWEPGDGDEKWC